MAQTDYPQFSWRDGAGLMQEITQQSTGGGIFLIYPPAHFIAKCTPSDMEAEGENFKIPWARLDFWGDAATIFHPATHATMLHRAAWGPLWLSHLFERAVFHGLQYKPLPTVDAVLEYVLNFIRGKHLVAPADFTARPADMHALPAPQGAATPDTVRFYDHIQIGHGLDMSNVGMGLARLKSLAINRFCSASRRAPPLCPATG